MALTILNVAYPLAEVGPDAPGGAEQVLAMIDSGLVSAGHRSLVVAPEGSRVTGTLIPTPAVTGPLDDHKRAQARAEHARVIERVLGSVHVDVIHFHGVDFPGYLPQALPCPALATLHLPPSWYPRGVFDLPARGVVLQCVSESQKRACPRGSIAAVVPNGVRLDQFRPGTRHGDCLLTLSRICPEKGVDRALEAAHRADASLLVAGPVFPYPEHEQYFRRSVVPLLDDKRRFIGAIGARWKRRLMSSARAVLVPSVAQETSSLVTMEALACGTPVIAFRSGALPEVVADGRTGFVVKDAEGMAEAIGRIGEIDRDECRADAERRFSADAMLDGYFDLYRELTRRRRSFPRALRTELLTRSSELERLREPWAELWARVPSAPPFVHPDWLLPWCRHFGRDQVSTIAVWSGSRLVALAPMEQWNEQHGPVLKLLGSGVSDALDVLVDPTESAAAGRSLRDALRELVVTSGDCEFAPLREGSALLSLPDLTTRGEQRAPCDVSPQLALTGARALEDAVPHRTAANARYCARRLSQLGRYEELVASSSDVPRLIDALFELHAARWGMRGQRGVLADERVRAFHREVASRFSQRGLLRLHALMIDDRPVAVLQALAAHGRCHYYLSGFDPSLGKLSPGTVVTARAIEDAIRRGDRVFDFLRGAEAYKYAWGAKDALLWRRTVSAADQPQRSREEAVP